MVHIYRLLFFKLALYKFIFKTVNKTEINTSNNEFPFTGTSRVQLFFELFCEIFKLTSVFIRSLATFFHSNTKTRVTYAQHRVFHCQPVTVHPNGRGDNVTCIDESGVHRTTWQRAAYDRVIVAESPPGAKVFAGSTSIYDHEPFARRT